MTVTFDDRRARYEAIASQTVFDIDFPIDSGDDVEVWQKVNATGVISLLTEGAGDDYVVALDGAAPNTGTATLNTGAAVDDIITVEGSRPPARASNFSTAGDYFANTVNTAEDRQYWIFQDLVRDATRSMILNRVTSDSFSATLPDTVASAFVGINAANTAFVMVAGISDVAVSSAMEPVVAAATVDAARGLLGAGTGDGDLNNVVEDTTPQLGGPLDTNGNTINFSEAAAVAAGASADIWGGDGNTLHLTGTGTVDTFANAPKVGASRWLVADAASTITHGSGITVPGSANYTLAAGDLVFVYADAVDAFRVTIAKVDGTAVVAGAALPVLIETVTISNDATVSITAFNNALYSEYEIELIDIVPATDGQNLRGLASTDGGSSYGSDYSTFLLGGHTGAIGYQKSYSAGAKAAAYIYLSGAGGEIGTAGGEPPYNAKITIYDAARASVTDIGIMGSHHDASASAYFMSFEGRARVNLASDVDAFRFYSSSGNITSGIVKLWGTKLL